MTLTTSLVGLVSLVGVMTLVWIVSLFRRDVSIVDLFWGAGFVIVSWVYWNDAAAVTTRQLVVMGLVHVWGLRLSLYLLTRNWGRPEDRRYRAMRERAGASFAWKSLLTVFWLQAGLAWVISFPVHAVLAATEPVALTRLDWLGLALFVVGLGYETVGDFQLTRFKADPNNAGEVCAQGLWRYTRHPNYFGEAVLWWGLACFAVSTPGAGWTVVGPILMTVLLLRVSGVTLLESNLQRTRPGYADYVARTSAFIPWRSRSGGGRQRGG